VLETKLAKVLEAMVVEKKNGVFVRGKFDLNSDEPYSGIAAAFRDIFR
jgi:predicted ATPase